MYLKVKPTDKGVVDVMMDTMEKYMEKLEVKVEERTEEIKTVCIIYFIYFLLDTHGIFCIKYVAVPYLTSFFWL